ncbi:MAG: glycine cleavage system protein H [Chloroflexi bacterium]|nr:glycine cleavage system protein H [Chloroflexota bacterium]
MATFYGCQIPEELYYHPNHNSWVRFEGEETAVLGMTDPAQTQAGKLLFVRFKKIGRKIKAGKFGATIESGKWIGPLVIPFAAEILETNVEAFAQDRLIANKDPYGAGWLIKVRVLEPKTARDGLITGEEAIAFFKNKIDNDDIRCFRCLDDPIPMM